MAKLDTDISINKFAAYMHLPSQHVLRHFHLLATAEQQFTRIQALEELVVISNMHS